MKKQDSNYNNESITSLKGAERVRLRPGVIFGSDGLDGCEHAFFEILSNSIDEAREGYGKKIEITRFKDDSILVRDHGRRIASTGSWCSVSCTQAANIRIIQEKTMNSAWV